MKRTILCAIVISVALMSACQRRRGWIQVEEEQPAATALSSSAALTATAIKPTPAVPYVPAARTASAALSASAAPRTSKSSHEGCYRGLQQRYAGVLTTEVTLQNNLYRVTKTFSVSDENKCFEVSGDYTRSSDGGRIELHGNVTPSRFIVGKDILIPLNDEGEPFITTGQIFCLNRTRQTAAF